MDMGSFKAEIQVDKDHYGFGHEVSFLNAYNQIGDVLFLIKKNKIANPKILVVGVGDSLVSTILKHKFGYYVRTVDIDQNLGPDFVGSIDEIDAFVDEKFDIVLCAHVLEHLPYKYFPQSLAKIQSIARYAVIYLPIGQFGLRFNFCLFPIFSKQADFLITWFFKKHKFDGQHYWEIGTRGYPLSLIRKQMEAYFKIEREYNAKNWRYSYNFVLESRR